MTLTNGVSFSLVAGACCLVNYTNAVRNQSIYDTLSAWTLNINSTGAKYVTYKDRAAKVITSESAGSNGSSTASILTSHAALHVYASNNYIVDSGLFRYSDYKDDSG